MRAVRRHTDFGKRISRRKTKSDSLTHAGGIVMFPVRTLGVDSVSNATRDWLAAKKRSRPRGRLGGSS